MKITDEMLMAYADGELDAAQRVEVERAIAADAQLAVRVKRHQALRQQVKGAFEQVLAEPIPERLTAALRKSAAPGPNDNVVSFKQRQQQLKLAQQARLRAQWSWPQWTAMAASLVVGALIGIVALNTKNSDVITARNGSLMASGNLANALSSQLSTASNKQIQMKLSFKTRSGEYCRSFVVKQQQSMAGLACRNGDEWRVPVLAAASGSDSTYRQAGSELPPAVMQWIDAERDGEALDRAEEESARQAEWKKQ